MAREINVKVKQSLTLSDGNVKKIFETSARKCGNGAIIYVPKENLGDRFYIIIIENDKNNREKTISSK